MKLDKIKSNAPEGAEKYRIKGNNVYYYKSFYIGSKFMFQRFNGEKWEETKLNDKSDLKPLN